MLTTINYNEVSDRWKSVPADARIVSVRITDRIKRLLDPKPQVWVRLDVGDAEYFLFDFYNDEIDFTEAELIGLTRSEAQDLYHKKDVAWLRSGL
jgi:hypothetical protein